MQRPLTNGNKPNTRATFWWARGCLDGYGKLRRLLLFETYPNACAGCVVRNVLVVEPGCCRCTNLLSNHLLLSLSPLLAVAVVSYLNHRPSKPEYHFIPGLDTLPDIRTHNHRYSRSGAKSSWSNASWWTTRISLCFANFMLWIGFIMQFYSHLFLGS
jgi:hypothetical protein